MNEISRRDFLGTILRGSLAFCIPSHSRAEERRLKADGFTRSRVVEVEGPVEESLKIIVNELGGIERFIRPGDTVLIKPNMSFPNPPERATTTDPEVVRAMIDLSLGAGARRIFVVDHPMRSSRLCLKRTGMDDVCKKYKNVHLIGAVKENLYKDVSIPNTKELKKTKIIRPFLLADVIINIPRMKSHSATVVSLGTKGNMGLIWDRRSFHVRLDLDEAIADLNTFIQADLTILDGTRVLTSGGPLGPGMVKPLNCLIGGTDPLAVDAYGAERVKWYGRTFKSWQIPHLVACHKRGIGEIDLDRIEVVRRKVAGL